MRLQEILKYSNEESIVEVVHSLGESEGGYLVREIKDANILEAYVIVHGIKISKGRAKEVISPDSVAWNHGLDLDDVVPYIRVEVV